MKIISANDEIPGMNSMGEAEAVLRSKLNLQLATIDETGYPNIQPVWFDYDKDKNRFYVLTSSKSKKTLNIRSNTKVYFSVDDCNLPYKGVKGRGTATIFENQIMVMQQIAKKIGLKYYGTIDHPGAKTLIDRSKESDAVLIEISPKFFSTWDFGKMQQ